MVSEYFKLREHPFGVTPDPKYLYASASHREALASLLYGLQSGLGFVSLIAKPGMGKTTLLFEVLTRLRDTRTTVFIFQTISTPMDLLRAILIDLGVKEVRESIVDLQTQLNRVLLTQCSARKPVVVVIDEAQNLNDSVLETVRMLSNFETASQKLMQIILAGQPQLGEKLMAPDLLQLRQRISIFAHLTPLSISETAAYIHHRLKLAGFESGEPIFSTSAVALIARHSGGIPRNINNLCFNAMSLAFALKRSQIDSEIVNEVILDLNVGRHLQSAESSEFDFASFESSASNSDVNVPVESASYSSLRLQTGHDQKPLLSEQPALAVTSAKMGCVPEIGSAPEPASVYDRSTFSAHMSDARAIEQTHRAADRLNPAAVEPGPEPVVDGVDSPERSRWSDLDISNHKVQPLGYSPSTASAVRPVATDKESVSSDIALLNKPLFGSFGSSIRWRSGSSSWNHTAIVATVVTAALCVCLGLVDYRILFPDEAIQASSKDAAPAVPMNDSENVHPSEPVPSVAHRHKGWIRVTKAESMTTLCNSIYGECTPDLLEHLLALNPTILYPNRLQPGQIISIPLNTHNATTEK